MTLLFGFFFFLHPSAAAEKSHPSHGLRFFQTCGDVLNKQEQKEGSRLLADLLSQPGALSADPPPDFSSCAAALGGAAVRPKRHGGFHHTIAEPHPSDRGPSVGEERCDGAPKTHPGVFLFVQDRVGAICSDR